jgi:diguanylate cyclase (GGDEF)-like protein
MQLHATTYRIVPPRTAVGIRACLVKIHPDGPGLGERHDIGDAALLAGRDVECDLRIEAPAVSRRHARIQPAADGYYVVDLGSTNGTFVNNQRVTKARLRPGDAVRIGSCTFRFLAADDLDAAYDAEIRRLANIDPLTDTHTRRSFLDALERELACAKGSGRPLSVLLFALDDFRTLADCLGPPGTDALVREAAARLRSWVRPGEVLGRISEQELAFVAPNATAAEAAERTRDICRQVSDQPFEHEGEKYPLLLMAAACTADGHAAGALAFLHDAAKRLAVAKRAGHPGQSE